MTPEESEKIAATGTVFFQNIPFLIFGSGLFGVYILAYIVCMNTILRKESSGRAHKALVVLLLAGFVMVVSYSCAKIVFNLLLVKFSFMVSLSGGFIAQEMAANLKSIAPNILEEWTGNFTPSPLLIVLLTLKNVNKLTAYLGSTETLDWLSIVLNLTVNIVATLLIAYRAWTHHRSARAILRNKKTQVQAILLLMVESGAIFGVVQLANIIIQALDIHNVSLEINDVFFFLQSCIYSVLP
ncbi:hypothetical protein BT96DRAFT_974168 [Gymnopus androsaceus JB14]|uniref:Uncharacterized protein n=1 Tax=Gymnopus androsaceus JB14 TaxID=1447944 RepID=A0A6A4I1T7_9AGAR|nr:hypothetical protein BT96DRAFT_974168 [Gymnopus androsaceus JB14]